MTIFLYKSTGWWLLFFLFFWVGIAQGQLELKPDKEGFMNCVKGDRNDFKLGITNISGKDDFVENTFSLDWGDGSGELKNVAYADLNTSHLYTKLGVFKLVVRARRRNGQEEEKVYEVKNLAKPAIGFEKGMEGTPCVNSVAEFVVSNYEGNTTETFYTLDFGDKTKKVYTQEQIAQMSGKVQHSYTKTHCELGHTSGITIQVTAENECALESSIQIPRYVIILPPTADFVASVDPGCTEKEVFFQNRTEEGAGENCESLDLDYEWDFGAQGVGVGQERMRDPVVVYDKPGVYTVTLKIESTNFSCAKAKKSKTIRIIERVEAIVTPEKTEVCAGSSVTLDASGSAGDEKKYEWSVVKGSASAVKFLPNAREGKVNAEFREPGDYLVRVKVYNSCSEDTKEVAVHVKKDPVVRKKGEIQALCPKGSQGETGLVLMGNYVEYDWYNNPQKAQWKVEPAEGWKQSAVSGDPLRPAYEFTKPGTYKVTVEISGAGCGAPATQLTQSWSVTIYDPSLTMNVSVEGGKMEMCEGEEVRFRNGTSAAQSSIAFMWTVYKNGKEALLGTDYRYTSGNNHSKEPGLAFLTYGDYVVKVKASVSCNEEQQEFQFHIKKAPEIKRFDLPVTECTPYVLLLRRFVEYNWYNDTEKRVTWTVEGPADGWEYLSGMDEHSLTPELKFTQPGEYRLKVVLAGVGCSGGKTTETKTLKILNPVIEKDISIRGGKSVICEGETVVFENHTVSDIPVEYRWVVEANNGATEGNGFAFVGGTSATAKEPQITFSRYGDYTVIARMTTDCNRNTSPTEERFNVTVQRDPEVELRNLPALCPEDYLVLDNSLVTYRWNRNTEEVEWMVEAMDGGASLEGVTYDADALYPKFRFAHSGNYKIRVYLLNRAGCGGTALEAEQVVHVYDPTMQLEVTPDQQMVQEGETFHFTNRSQAAETPSYQWSVSPAGGWEWVGKATDVAPDIRFTRFGEYTVKVVMTSRGGCTVDSKEMKVVVKGIPEYHLPDELDAICIGGTVDMKEKLSYETKGATIVPRWTVSPGSEGVEYDYLNDGKGTVIQPEIRFLKNGRYTLTLQADAEYGGRQVHVTHVNVLKTSVKALTLSNLRGCTKQGSPLEVVLKNDSEGDSLAYAWQVTPATGHVFASGHAGSRQPTLRITEKGDYKVVLKAWNICNTDQAEFNIHAFTNPVIDPIKDIRDECDKFYVFKGKEVVKVDSNGERLESVKWTITPAGYAYGEGFGASDLYPEIRFKGGETPYRLKLEVQNGCGDVISRDFSVLVDEYREIVKLRDTALCSMSGNYALKAEPAGGVWTCRNHAVGKDEWTGGYYFTPKEDTEKTYRLYYTYGHKSCTAVDSLKLTVHPLPAVQVEKDKEDACINWEKKVLQPGVPANGRWMLNGMRITEFDPAVYGVGVHRLEYWYTDPLTRCSNLDTLKIEVHGLPDASFRVADRQCKGIDSLYVPVELGKGHHFSWNFSGTARETEDAPAKWYYTAVGEYDVTLQATSVYQCKSELYTRTVKVLDQPPTAEFALKDTAGCGPFTTQAEVNPGHFVHPAGDYYELGYLWEYGNGERSTALQPLVQTYEPTLYDTVYCLRFSVYNVCGMERDSADIGVWSSAVAHFSMNPDPESARGFCTPITPVFINASTGSGNAYTWDFSGLGLSHAVDTVYTFTTGVSPSVFTVTLTARNRCDETNESRTFKVKPNPIVAGFTMDEKYLCAGDTVCFTNHSVDRDEDAEAILSYKWDFGDGQVNDVWDTCHHYSVAGTYAVTLSLDNGCARQSFVDSVVVYALPQLVIQGDSALCEDDKAMFTLETSEPLKNILWSFGDSTPEERSTFAVEHVFEEPGHFVVQVSATGDQIAGCTGKGEKSMVIWSKPRVTIVPLDTLVCPVYHYMPEINRTEYDYFTWDYGDGSPLTSELSHDFVNETQEIVVYRTSVHVVNQYGCEEDHSGVIRVFPGPTAAWDKEISYGRPEKVRFINLSEDYTDCYWYLPFAGVVNSPSDQTVEFPDEGVYPVALVAVNEFGCRDSIAEDYRSYQGGLYFPNTFIPHSKNPLVSRFNGVGMGLKAYKLEIFDTYGNKIWETRALEGGMPSEGWDGRNRQGKKMPQGVYMWRAEAIFYSEDIWTGKNNRSGVSQTTQGSVFLLRE
ncbi:MAG: PKD domain-containing protein [Odoribacter sp.]|nr:PKD domain-containing protein [Odoribacter sp.]